MPSAKNTTNLKVDPGIPRECPTVSFWQQPLHPLAAIASERLSEYTDVLIIGSGITGCSVAKTILENDKSFHITVLEARGLASGASSRNGGHIVSPSFGDFIHLVETFGPEAAVEIAEFTINNVEATFQAVAELHDPALSASSELRTTEKVLGLADQETFNVTKKTLELWNKYMPKSRQDEYRIVSAKEAEERYGLKNVVGAAVGLGAAVWPYRLWTGFWANLLRMYSDRLHVETHTPAMKVTLSESSDSGSKYAIETPRGTIHAAHVVYATNGFTSHFLPALQDKMFPVRGTMSTQDLGDKFPRHGSTRSWSFLKTPQVDPTTGTADAGLYYLTQNPVTGHMFLGGEHDDPEVIVSADDCVVNPLSAEKLGQVLKDSFINVPDGKPDLVATWSGIMGMTRDGIPLVGRVPDFVTSRAGGQEWIAAGFNGYGTGYCFLCGKAVGELILGKQVSWLPDAFKISEKRLNGSLSSSTFWAGLIGPLEGHHP